VGEYHFDSIVETENIDNQLLINLENGWNVGDKLSFQEEKCMNLKKKVV
jgi:hypothetical protein